MASLAPPSAALTKARLALHTSLLASGVLAEQANGKASIADNANETSKLIALGLIRQLKGKITPHRLVGQTAGKELEDATRDYLNAVMPKLASLLPGTFEAARNVPISEFAQYRHMRVLEDLASERREVRLALGGDYLVTPDVVLARLPMGDLELNQTAAIVDGVHGVRASLRRQGEKILHASISCKATIRSDRSQNSRLEALNLLRMRRGRAPHIVVVTAEPLPSRLASIALGTGDFDCIYHIALPELRAAAEDAIRAAVPGRLKQGRPTRAENSRIEQLAMLDLMIDSDRLKDISDLPLDLVL